MFQFSITLNRNRFGNCIYSQLTLVLRLNRTNGLICKSCSSLGLAVASSSPMSCEEEDAAASSDLLPTTLDLSFLQVEDFLDDDDDDGDDEFLKTASSCCTSTISFEDGNMLAFEEGWFSFDFFSAILLFLT